ncbi:MAG TPA: TonB family protein [Pyrinomonadaceae bacterium]|nr:TonB family protein [Pyrinomonadaceae bacterium]
MFNPIPSAKSALIALIMLASTSVVSAQSNLTAKTNGIQPQPAAPVESDRMRDGLAGPVRRVRTEVSKLSNANGQAREDRRVVLETAAYDIKGIKTENQYFPVAGSTLTGKEVYKYDERGNISEMTLLNGDGTLLGKEIYKYDYDSVGNWTRMTTSVAVVEGGKVTFEPTEVTYRAITYYLDENVLKMAQPGAAAVAEAPKPVQVETKAPVPTAPPRNNKVENKAVASKVSPSLPPVKADGNVNAVSANVLSTSNTGSSSNPGVVIDTPPPPPARTPKPILKPVSGGVLNGQAVFLPAPAYPETAKRMRTIGVVTVEVVVDETGKVISAQASSGPAILRDVSVLAATKARFSPTMLSGQPVKVTGLINYKFSLSQ